MSTAEKKCLLSARSTQSVAIKLEFTSKKTLLRSITWRSFLARHMAVGNKERRRSGGNRKRHPLRSRATATGPNRLPELWMPRRRCYGLQPHRRKSSGMEIVVHTDYKRDALAGRKTGSYPIFIYHLRFASIIFTFIHHHSPQHISLFTTLH
jgi:hypothetical protein